MSTEPTATEGPALDEALTSLRGVGPSRARLFERLGLVTLRDLVLYLPRRLESAGRAVSIAEALASESGDVVVFHGTIEKHRFQRFGRRSTLRLTVARDGEAIEVVYFNQPWQRERFRKGSEYSFAGRVTHSDKGALVISPQSAEGPNSLPTDRWFCVYGVTAGLGQELVRSLMQSALERVRGELTETLAPDVLAELELPPLESALIELHAPTTLAAYNGARRRVLLEALLPLQARVLARAERAEGEGLHFAAEAFERARARMKLPWNLTAGQESILLELQADLDRRLPMRRLLQGDVGSGKTVLGLLACAAVAAGGAQSAFMAPTELLAEQHYYGLRTWLEAAGLRAELLTGSLRRAERRALLRNLEAGDIDVLFGTHALFSADVHFARLALAVIDEQHRFGVAQRARLVDKGHAVHLLLMTATPIPRTLALTLYGDLEVSLLREKPPGRGEVRTRWLRPKDGERLPDFLRERLRAGEQVYWVCPLIGAEEQSGAEHAAERLRASDLAEFGIELVHGRMPAEERAARLASFRAGDVRVLVATTVIEVGVDVPNATVMVIEQAERLGLAQLHQLRGRVGRSELESWCLLYGKPVAKERFQLLETCNDGFELAEADLARRGMGELAGRRQSGEFGGLLATLEGDVDLLLAARDLLQADSALRRRLAAQRADSG